MSETIRVFVAAELPGRARRALADLIEGLRRADIRGLRLVRPEGIHLTLKFLGNIDADRVDPVASALSKTAQNHRACTLRLGSGGVFPRPSLPRVLWVGMEGQLADLLLLRQDIEEAMASLGFPHENRKFDPHLTVARIREGTPLNERLRAAQTMSSYTIDQAITIRVDAISLMQSKLLEDGAVYQRLARLPLRVA